MSVNTWNEIVSARNENKHELFLQGQHVSVRIEKQGLDKELFSLTNLNFLNISETCLEHVPDDIGKLINLTALVLHSNKIVSLPVAIGKLVKLKVLDLSRNKIEAVQNEILSNLQQITTLNLACNALKEIPSLAQHTKLSVLDLSVNKFEAFPDICHAELVLLSEVKLNSNEIKDIPASVSNLPSLKVLDVGDNVISTVPGELAEIPKLKEINLKGNKLSDKRLLKLVEQCRSKQVLDYVRQHCPHSSPATDAAAGGGKGKKGKKGKKSEHGDTNQVNISVDQICNKMQVLHVSDSTPVVRIADVVKQVRPFIMCCIVRDINFTPESLQKFIRLQTKLHDTVCEKRNAATIATHDLNLLKPGFLTYTALPPTEVIIRPLMRNREYSGQELFNQLQKEADDLRKEKKRNTYSGIHRFVYLLEGKPVFPVLQDTSEQVISFPPITNSDVTKLSVNTKNMFVEVTSAASQTVCRTAMDTLLLDMLMLGLGDEEDSVSEGKKFHSLKIEQVKIVDMEGNMKAVYPGRSDLLFEDKNLSVLRE